MLRRGGGILLLLFGLALLPFSIRAADVRTPLEALTWGGTLALIVGGFIVLVMGVHVLDLYRLDGQFAAYTGFGIEYMQKIPSETEIFAATRPRVASDS